MQVDRRTRRQLRVQSWISLLLFLAVIGLLGWLSTRYSVTADWTAGARNSLSEASVEMLGAMPDPITVTAFAREEPVLRKGLRELVERYRRVKPDITLQFVNPDTNPDEVRRQGITLDGELLISYQGRSEKLQSPSEEGVTNLLQRLARGTERWIVFLEGHGERKPDGNANFDLGSFAGELERKGINTQTLSLAINPQIPDNTALLVIAGPQTAYLPGEVSLILDYLAKGGNLLWLTEPETNDGLQPLAEELGISRLPGTVVDANTQMFGIEDPANALVAEYPAHPALRGMDVLTLFPHAAALQHGGGDWRSSDLLQTLPRTWNETGPISGTIRVDEAAGEVAGPLTIGLELSRAMPGGTSEETMQRVIVVGDGDFLTNAYLGNGGNLALGMSLMNWLSHDDAFVAIKPRTAVDQGLALSTTASALISIGFLIVLPLGLIGSGVVIWLRRRKR